MNQPAVTWLLPVKNAMPYLTEALASIAAQTYVHHTVLAWDNGSTDGSADELRRWVPSRIPGRVITDQPMGLGACLAKMVEMADSPLCARIDGDDVNLPNRLERQVRFMQLHPEVAVLGTDIQFMNEASEDQPGAWSVSTDDADIRWRLRFCNALNHPTVVFRRDAILRAGNYRDVMPGQDYDLWVRVAQRARLANLPEKLVRYRLLETSVGATHRGHDRLERIADRYTAELYPDLSTDQVSRLRRLLASDEDSGVTLGDYRNLRRCATAAARQAREPRAYFRYSTQYRQQARSLLARWLKGKPMVTAARSLVGKKRQSGPPSPATQSAGTTAASEPASHIVLCDRFWPDTYGGLERKMWNLSRALAGCGLGVSVITENRTNAPEHEAIKPNLSVQRVGPINYGPFWRCISLMRVFWWRKIIRTQAGPGTLWVNDPRIAVATVLAGRRRDLVYQPIGCATARNRLAVTRPEVYTMRASGVLRFLDRLAHRLAPRVIHESDNVLKQFQDCYGDRRGVRVVHNGVEPAPLDTASRAAARRRWGLDNTHWVVGFVGRLDPTKDLGFLFNAVSRIEDSQDIRLLLVGDGPDQERLQTLATELGIADRIIWAGRCDDPAEAFAAMDAMVLPSVYEAFGNVLMEAMAAGVPVIGRRRDADPSRPVLTPCDELIENGVTGLLVDPHDPADLARQLQVLRLFPGARDAMGRQGRRLTTGRSWDSVVRQYLRVISQPVEHISAQAA